MIPIILGVLLIITGLLYFYSLETILKISQWIKKILFNEKTIVLHRKKIGFVLLMLGLVIIMLKLAPQYIKKDKYYTAYKLFYRGNFKDAEKICLEILSSSKSLQLQHSEIVELLGKIYIATQRYTLAKKWFLQLKTIDPKKEKKVDKYLELIEQKEKANK